MIQHYKKIALNTNLPIILYNVPSRTGVNIEPQICFELSKIKNVVGIKEASGNISQVAKISALCGDDLYIYSGNDDQILPVLSVGGIGVISVLSNIMPQYTHDVVKQYFEGNLKQSSDMQIKCLNLINCLFSEVNPIPVKEALNMIGFKFGIPRLPLVRISDASKEKLQSELKSFNLLEV